MLLLERLVETTEKTSTCEVTITPHTLFLEAEGVPAYVGLEYMAQAIAAHGGYVSYRAGEPVALGLLLGTPKWHSACRTFALGQTLRIHVRHIWGDAQLLRFHCTIIDAATGQLLQQADVNVFKPADAQQYLRRERS
jgi:predicted hotdog family 3-hydroxylacyl-ACP dehydratase